MKRALKIVGVLAVIGVIAGYVVTEYYWNTAVTYGSRVVNYFRYMNAPAGTLTVETSPEYKAPQPTTTASASSMSSSQTMPGGTAAANGTATGTGGASNAAPGSTPVAGEAQAGDAPSNAASGVEARMASGTEPTSAPKGQPQVAPSPDEWPSYNRTLTSDRYSPLDQINTDNVKDMKVACTYDTGEYTGFNSGLLEVNGSLLFSTEYNTYSIDPNTCKLNWKAHEDYQPATPQGVNRGPAYMDNMVFRGLQNGRVVAYDFKTGEKLWETQIADPKKGESVPAAPVAWNGMVFVGNAGGDIKGVKGRMYGIDAKTGKVKWEFYLVPKTKGDASYGPDVKSPLTGETWGVPKGSPITGGATWTSYTIDPATGLLYIPGGNPAPDFAAHLRKGGNLYSGSVVVLDAMTGAYQTHFKIVPKDWHDWDVSSAPAIVTTAAGRKIMTLAPKDGHLYGYDLATKDQLYRLPVTKMLNTTEGFEHGKSVHFCPGSTGGAEWNGAAYDKKNNLTMVGEVQWCTTVTLKSDTALLDRKNGQTWGGEESVNPYNTWGKADPTFDWAGWVYGVNADTGQWKWRAKSNYPVQSGVTPTGGDLVFFGDMGGNFYALNADTGEKLWGEKIGGAIGGGVITYDAGKGQRVAAATGLTEVLWPTEITTAKVSVLEVPGAASTPAN